MKRVCRRDVSAGNLSMDIFFLPGAFNKIHNTLTFLRNILESNPQVTHSQIFTNVEPILAKYYSAFHSRHKDIMQEITALYLCNT